jgi:hypothetical protein
MYRAEIVADSVNPKGVRLTTWLLEYPLIVHGEHLRHREQSFSVASNRAIPTAKIIEKVTDDPFIPVSWGKNQRGMQADEELDATGQAAALSAWLVGRDAAIIAAQRLLNLGIHKQIANRVLNPWQWVTVVCSATRWDNFFALRAHKAAQPEIQRLAVMMVDAYHVAEPRPLKPGEWHLPFIRENERGEWETDSLKAFSAARCARTSLLNHLGVYAPEDDFRLHAQLRGSQPPHASPFEHVAQCCDDAESRRNFHGWKQYRCELSGDTTRRFDYEAWQREYYGERVEAVR